MRRKPLLIVTPGDPAGIGPEVSWKAIRALAAQPRPPRILCIGAESGFDRIGLKYRAHNENVDLDSIEPASTRRPLELLVAPRRAPKGLLLPGYQVGWSLEVATRLILRGHAAALTTGPISKDRLQKGGFPYSGHTDLLAELCHVPEVTMMLANKHLRVSLVTVHTALRTVPQQLDRSKILRALEQTLLGLQSHWRIKHPRIAVAALNPHAGEGGLFGSEDQEIIAPALAAFQKRFGDRCTLVGPLPADTLFANHVQALHKDRFDAVVCMYHDQGLIPVKLLDFPKTVNITLGLPLIRTSVDHGTAFDIAGKDKADPSSMLAALQLAVRFSKDSK